MNESSLLEKTLSSSLFQRLSDTVAETIQKSLPTIDLSSLEACLDTMNKDIQEFKEQVPTAPQTQPPWHSLIPEDPPALTTKKMMDCPEQPYELYKDEFLTSDEVGSVADLLGFLKDGGDFVNENGHSVRLYGEPYSYTGSRSSEPDPIPQELESIINKLSEELALEERPNSVLINYYPATSKSIPCDSHLAMHSDDESTILASSKIITLSIGASRRVVFQPKHSGQESVELDVKHNSLYVMTKSSQNWYRHGIPSPAADQDVEERFSVTFRCLSKQFKRSILLMGDSNTKEVNFGSGTGKVGESFPGKRVKASRVKNIDPHQCIGYSNVFLMCGTNDLRCENVKMESDVHKVVDELRHKLSDIKQLCPKTKIFVVPVMPSRIPRMNSNITMYNELVDQMLFSCFNDIWFQGIYSFLDEQGMLSLKVARPNDKIHLGSRGIAKLVTYMKSCVFKREKMDSPKLAKHNMYMSQGSTQMVGSPDPT